MVAGRSAKISSMLGMDFRRPEYDKMPNSNESIL